MNKKIMVSSLGFVFAAFAMSGIAFAQEASSSKAAPEAKAPAEVVRPAPKGVAPKENAGEKKLKKAQPGDKGKVMPKPRGKMNGKGFEKPRGNMGCKCNCGCCAGRNRKFARPNGKMDGKKMMPMPKDGNKKFDGKNLPGRKFPGGEFKKGEIKEGEVPAPKPVAPKEAPKDAGEKKVK